MGLYLVYFYRFVIVMDPLGLFNTAHNYLRTDQMAMEFSGFAKYFLMANSGTLDARLIP